MMYRQFSTGEIFHIYNRGVDKRRIYNDARDYQRFFALLYLCNSTKLSRVRDVSRDDWFTCDRGELLVHIGAYCLMPNHFHIIVRQAEENGISKFMQKIMTAYTMYFNLRNNRTGRLFESSYKAKHEFADEQLRHLFAYVHLNPLSTIPDEVEWKKGIKDKKRAVTLLSTSLVTSFQNLTSKGEKTTQHSILHTDAFPDYFRIAGDGTQTLHEWVDMY